MSGRVHVHPAEAGKSGVEEAILKSGQLDLPVGRVLVGVTRDPHGLDPDTVTRVYSYCRHSPGQRKTLNVYT